MTILVTGATGFLGTAIVEQALASGIFIRGISRNRPPFASSNYLEADVTRPDTLPPTLVGVTRVIHSAGLAHQFNKTRSGDRFREVNEVGTANVARASVEAGVKQLVLVSSASVYGRSPSGPRDETTECRPDTPYGISKLNAEREAIRITSGTSTKLTILRMATIYGEGDPGNVGRLMRAIDRGRFVWLGTGENNKSLVYKDDAARACLIGSELTTEGGSQVYNVSAPAHPMREVVRNLADALDRTVPEWNIPGAPVLRLTSGLAWLAGEQGVLAAAHNSISAWLSDDVCDGTRFEREFNFSPAVQLREGLAREVIWYRKNQSSA